MFKNLNRTAALLFALFALAFVCVPSTRAQGNAQSGTPSATPTPAQSAAPSAPQTTGPSTGLQRTGDGHEYAPLLEQKINYKDWKFKTLGDGKEVSLRELSKGKKLVMVVYFAPWCGNWKAEAPTVWRLYDKYKKDGFEVVAVSEYASVDDARKYFESQGGAPFPVVVESEATSARDQTTHFGYRQACGDPRRWGSPFNIFLEPSKLNKDGEVLTEKAMVVGGELVEQDIEQFIREKLGLNATSTAEPCKDEPPAKAEVKKQ
jgi:thiol-disulfide isomerase/thioredoxin